MDLRERGWMVERRASRELNEFLRMPSISARDESGGSATAQSG